MRQSDLEHDNRKYCGHDCKILYKIRSKRTSGKNNPMYGKTGELNPKWNPDRTYEQRLKERTGRENYVWRTNVLERDDYLCKCCGVEGNGSNLNVHHIYNYKDYPKLRYEINNGITLCERCHINFHILFGKEENTKEQLITYIKNIRNVEVFDLDEILNKSIIKLTVDFKPYKLIINRISKYKNTTEEKDFYTAKEASEYAGVSYSGFVNQKYREFKEIVAKNGDSLEVFRGYEETARHFSCSSSTIKDAIVNELIKINDYSFHEETVQIKLIKRELKSA